MGAIALLFSLCLGSLPAAAGQPNDAWVTTQVKMKLLTSDQINAFDVNVDTTDGFVTLHGRVETEASKANAAQLAKNVDGVRDVRNLLAVVPEAAAKDVATSDDAVRSQVENVLERDGALAESDIAVKSVNDGTVVLSGTADSLSAHKRALEDARSVEGVERVASEIRSPDELADREIWNEEMSDDDGSSLGAAASDTWITSKAKVRLMADPGISPFAVNVDTHRGVVTLFGSVSTEEASAAAEREVREIDGVKAVENELQVVPDVAAKRVEREDEKLQAAVEKRIEDRESLADDEIAVAVSDGVVRLTGNVGSHGEKIAALTIARTTDGVRSTVDGLSVRPNDAR
jgi:osmotically-inducible protein OsmY